MLLYLIYPEIAEGGFQQLGFSEPDVRKDTCGFDLRGLKTKA